MKKVFLFFLLFGTTVCFSQDKPGLKLWYKQPSGKTWENALPIGNGRLGAMIYGNVDKEIIRLNEHTVWSGSPNHNTSGSYMFDVNANGLMKSLTKNCSSLSYRDISKSYGGMILHPSLFFSYSIL